MTVYVRQYIDTHLTLSRWICDLLEHAIWLRTCGDDELAAQVVLRNFWKQNEPVADRAFRLAIAESSDRRLVPEFWPRLDEARKSLSQVFLCAYAIAQNERDRGELAAVLELSTKTIDTLEIVADAEETNGRACDPVPA